jgi:sporulation protein YlmC with PRC-barrel domain
MDIQMNVDVFCTDRKFGRTTRVILNPKDKTITHLVVKESEKPHSRFFGQSAGRPYHPPRSS